MPLSLLEPVSRPPVTALTINFYRALRPLGRYGARLPASMTKLNFYLFRKVAMESLRLPEELRYV